MKEKPILFNTQMVQAILAGNKTQTRRIADFIVPEGTFIARYSAFKDRNYAIKRQIDHDPIFYEVVQTVKSKYEIGDILWVRETVVIFKNVESYFAYKADGNYVGNELKWTPSIHMPRSAARIFLEVTNVRVERLKEISAIDIKCEGILPDMRTDHPRGPHYTAFISLWESINGKGCWNDNPWVWVYEFEKVKP